MVFILYWREIAAVAAAVIAVALVIPVRVRVRVFADQVDVACGVAGVPISRQRIGVSDIVRCYPVREQVSDAYLWHVSPGGTFIAFAGDGVHLQVRGPMELTLGSRDPVRLAEAINAARFLARPAVGPLGSVGDP